MSTLVNPKVATLQNHRSDTEEVEHMSVQSGQRRKVYRFTSPATFTPHDQYVFVVEWWLADLSPTLVPIARKDSQAQFNGAEIGEV